MTEFVEGWVVAQVLGEGAYGEVRLLVHGATGACVAVKAARGGAEGAREAALHRALRHPHVLRCLGERTHLHHHYLFLEYAQGGELFDRIEADAGMDGVRARRYWRETLSGLQYVHGRGVAHRDIKPENLLLDQADHVKISDFGLATVYRHAGRERALTRVCGTPPYAAPEVLSAPAAPYRAEPADLWSAAVVLVAMLAGELPWERAADSDARYAAWRASCEAAGADGGGVDASWWSKVRARGGAGLVRAALQPDPARRCSLQQALDHAWLTDQHSKDEREEYRLWSSQPARGGTDELSQDDMDALLCQSQPGGGAGGVGPLLVRRDTRLWVRCEADAALRALEAAARGAGLAVRALHLHVRLLSLGGELRVRAWAVSLPGGAGVGGARAVLELRRSRGCWLQFKRLFQRVSAALQPLSAPPPAPLPPLAEPLLDNTMTAD